MTFPALSANTPSGYFLTKSLRFRSSASAYMNRTPASATNRKTYTWSAWVKRGKFADYQAIICSYSSTNVIEVHRFYNDDTFELEYYNGSFQYQLKTTQVLRDPSAWYHIVVAVDTTQATAANRIKVYINGSQVTSFSTATYPSQNADLLMNNNIAHGIGVDLNNGRQSYYDGYIAEFNLVDGQQLTASSFGSTNATTGVWQPIRYTGTYGTNGFYLPFTNTTSTTTLGYDSSGNGNNWTTNNFSLTAGATYDSMTDVPTLTSATVANYCTLNPIGNPNVPITTYSAGNLQFSNAGSSGNAPKMSTQGTIGVSSGKWYYEFTGGSSGNTYAGFSTAIVSGSARGSAYFSYVNSGGTSVSAGISVTGTPASFTTNDVIGVAFDIGSGTATLYKNGVSQATLSSIPAGIWFSYTEVSSSASASDGIVNFGQRPFAYTPPTGYVALNTYNLPDSTIVAGNKYMDATTYTGDGTTNRAITNTASFQPDLVWVKDRSNAGSHLLVDSVRTPSNVLFSNSTAAATTENPIPSINSNGFSVNEPNTGADSSNINAHTYVGWQWQAGQGTTSSNTSGSITTTVSVNASTGFSIIKYAGNNSSGSATLGHGLGVAPVFMIFKNRDQTGDWGVYHQNMNATPQNYYMQLNLDSAAGANSTIWNNTAPTSSVVSVGSYFNGNGINYIGYVWAEIAGFSKFGSYTGNGSADGPFIYTGFRPKFVLVKKSSASGNAWGIVDTSRDTYNVCQLVLRPNSSAAEVTASSTPPMDIISNGFKCRSTWDDYNGSGATYIYAAFAENPFKNALAR